MCSLHDVDLVSGVFQDLKTILILGITIFLENYFLILSEAVIVLLRLEQGNNVRPLLCHKLPHDFAGSADAEGPLREEEVQVVLPAAVWLSL